MRRFNSARSNGRSARRTTRGEVRSSSPVRDRRDDAESDRCEVVEGNLYFPPEAVRKEFLQPSDTHTTCGWKGIASYHNVTVGGQVNKDAAWYYPDPKPAAKNIAGYIAFWKGVSIEN